MTYCALTHVFLFTYAVAFMCFHVIQSYTYACIYICIYALSIYITYYVNLAAFHSFWHAIHNGLRPAQCDLPDPGERCQGWQHHGFPRLLYPLSRDRVAACLATPCPGHAAFAGRTTRRRMAQRHPRRGRLRSAPRPHAHRTAAAAAVALACRTAQMWRTRPRMRC